MQDEARALSAMPALAWRRGEGRKSDFLRVAACLDDTRVARAEWAYHSARFEEAAALADGILADGDSLQRVVAACLKFSAGVMSGSSASAYPLMKDALEECHRAWRHPDERIVYESSIICAHIVEGLSGIRHEDIPESLGALEELPTGWQVYSGYQMAAMDYAQGRLLRALGAIKGFTAIAGDKYPVPCIKLRLLAACTYLRLRDVANARRCWGQAWEIASDLGLLAPFVELDRYMPGLTHSCLKGTDERSYRVLQAMVRTHRRGWLGLRRSCKAPVPDDGLSPLESQVARLAAWGWSNREMASYLDLAESTVKHHLTGVYQVFGIGGRRELVEYLMAHPGHVEGLVSRAVS